MTRWRMVFVLSILAAVVSMSALQAQKNAAEEKREAEKIREAEQALNKAKQELQGIEKKFSEAAKRVNTTDQVADKAKAAISKVREQVENKLEDSTGLPKALRAVETSKRELDQLAAPILAKLHQTPAYQAAVASAETAKTEKAALIESAELDDQALNEALKALNVKMKQPEALEQAAIQADSSAKLAADKLQQAQKEAANIREKVRDRIDNDPELKKAVKHLHDSQAEYQEALRGANVARAAVMRERQQVAAAANRVAAAKAADRKDDQQDKSKNNKGKKK
jgi:colicin import membrane protein